MAGDFLLDTNIAIALINREHSVHARLSVSLSTFVPAVVIGELYFGAYKSQRVNENLQSLRDFADSTIVLSCDDATARFYGEIKNQLRLKGKPIPENDIWIAAIAIQHDLTLVSRDAHFQEIDGLTVEVW